jgi:hypothetical protein
MASFEELLKRHMNMGRSAGLASSKWTGVALGAELNVTEKTVSNWINSRNLPSYVYFAKLCAVFFGATEFSSHSDRSEFTLAYQKAKEDLSRRRVQHDAERLGITAVFRNRLEKMDRGYLITKLINDASSTFWCAGIDLSTFVDHANLIRRRISDHNCTFRFIIFDSASDNARALDATFMRSPPTQPDSISGSGSALYQLMMTLRQEAILCGQFLIKKYTIVPPNGIIAIDCDTENGRVIVELNIPNIPGGEWPGFEVRKTKEGIFDVYATQFVSMWENSIPLFQCMSERCPKACAARAT